MKVKPTVTKWGDSSVSGFKEAGAVFSRSLNLRYVLFRAWDFAKPTMVVIGLNPSTADHLKLDPTVSKCVSFAKHWGYGRFYMMNAFAYRATQPQDMKRALQAVGAQNDRWLLRICRRAKLTIVAWGNDGLHENRCLEVLRLLKKNDIETHCLGINANGTPRHPLYLPFSVRPIPYPPNLK